MGFTRPEHDVMAAARDQAEAEHKAYWSENGNGYQPTGKYFPGFEKGWNDACDKLENGEDLGDIDAEAKNQAGGDPDAWEFEHGYKKGAEEAQRAGSGGEEHHEEEHHEEEPQE